MSDEARRGPAGDAQAVIRASSEDRKPVGTGFPPPAAAAAAVAHKIQLKSADMKEEMRQEAFEIARIVRDLRPRSAISSCARFGFRRSALVDGLFLGIWGIFFSSVDSFPVGQAFEKHSMEKDIAEYIKKEFDKNHGPTWHCIVGRNFGNALLPTPLRILNDCASCSLICLRRYLVGYSVVNFIRASS